MDKSTATHNSYMEVEEQINNLSDSDISQLLQTYSVLGCNARSGLSEHEVLNQVCLKALGLERKWPKNVNTMAFMVSTGRSIISNEEEKYSKLIVTSEVNKFQNINDPLRSASVAVILSQTPAETLIEHSQSEEIVAEWIQKIRQLFQDDPQAKCFIEQKINDQKKANILVLCQFTDQVYRNVEKKVKSIVLKKYPSGIQWEEIES